MQDVDDFEDALESPSESCALATKENKMKRDVSSKLQNQLQREDDIRLRLIALVKSLMKSARCVENHKVPGYNAFNVNLKSPGKCYVKNT